MFILNADPYLTPCYRISPFSTSDIAKNDDILNLLKQVLTLKKLVELQEL